MIKTFRNALRRAVCTCFSVVQRIPESNGILLTFDDGPHPNSTPAVLDLLRQYEAKAIFFICGSRIEYAPELPARIVAEGHVLGNHSFAHWIDKVPGCKEYADDLKKCNEIIAKLSGVSETGKIEQVKYFRAPHGSLRLAPLLAARKAGLRYIHWSVSVDDWELRDSEEAKRRGEILAQRAKPGDIVLLHDDNPGVLEILKIVLPVWKEKGWALDQWNL